jgi:hypothetical protein
MTGSNRVRVAVAAAVFLTLGDAGSSFAQPVAVTSCGQVLAGGGYLTADLDCSGQSTEASTVTLGKNGILDLRGFTLTGYAATLDPFVTVACEKSCIILGPGTIVGSAHGDLQVVVGFGNHVPTNPRRITVRGATITGGSIGVSAPRLRLQNATITGNRGTGVWSSIAKIDDSTITGNGFSTVETIPVGVLGWEEVRVRNSVVTGNAFAGIRAAEIRAHDSQTTGNDADPSCGSALCADLAASGEIVIKGSTSCDTSLVEDAMPAPVIVVGQPAPMGPIPNWGVCALD